MIRLQSLTIENFRGIREGKIEGLTAVNILVGRNNSGKTTVLEAITRVAMKGGLTTDALGRNVNQFWQTVHASAPNTDLMWYRQDKSNNLAIVGSIIADNDLSRQEFVSFSIPDSPPKTSRKSATIDAQSRDRFFSHVTVLRPQDAFSSDIEKKFWPELLSNRRDKVLTTVLNDLFGLKAESFQLLPNGQFIVLFEDHSLPLDSQGDGTRTSLRMMMVLIVMKGTLLMLEEPECYQHPGSLERFSNALCKMAKAQDVQLIVSTHSGDCVRSFLKAAKETQSDAAVFHVALEDGKQNARRLDPEAVETLASSGVDVRFLDLYA